MNQKMKNLIENLRLAEPIRTCDLKNRQIDGFFRGISDLGITVEDHVSGTIHYRNASYCDENASFSVTVIQVEGDEQDELFIIKSHFAEE